jgi:hypothetical protein
MTLQYPGLDLVCTGIVLAGNVSIYGLGNNPNDAGFQAFLGRVPKAR